MRCQPELYLDVAAVAELANWENVVVDAVDALAGARRRRRFMGIERRYYYVGFDEGKGKLWTEEYYLPPNGSLSAKPTGSLGSRAARSQGRGRKGRRRRTS